MKLKTIVPLTILFACLVALPEIGLAQAKKPTPAGSTADKPNILVIFGDDIGQTNVSAYSMGMMGYRTPNIDRIAKEGMIFTDYYAEQSCTAGRSSFITGQCTLRTGLSKVGVPGSPIGLQVRDVTMAQLLIAQGYATGQFGKNHLGDLNKYLPTVHGFDEFFGNLYHLNAEEEPERLTYPQDPKFKEMFGPRGVLKCKASDKDDPTDQPRWGRVGSQTIEDVHTHDFYFDPTILSGSGGQTLTISLDNSTSSLHNFSLPQQQLDQDVPPGQTVRVTVTLPASGELVFFCKYHHARGMLGALEAG